MLTQGEKAKIKATAGTMSFADMMYEVFGEEFTYGQLENAYNYCKKLHVFDYIHDKRLIDEVLTKASEIATEIHTETYELNPNVISKSLTQPLTDYKIKSIIINNTQKKRAGYFTQNEKRCLLLGFPFMEKETLIDIFYPRNQNNIYRTAYRFGLYRESNSSASQNFKVKDLKDLLNNFDNDAELRFSVMGMGGRYVVNRVDKKMVSSNETVFVGLMDEKISKKNLNRY